MKKLKQMYRCMEEWKYRNNKTTRCPTKTFGHDRQYGFTLVELVIVIAIVIILSVISVPIYRGYVDKSKMAEGYALLGQILSAQKTYYSEYGNFYGGKKNTGDWYSGKTSYDTGLGIDARSNKYFTVFYASHTYNPKIGFISAAIIPEDLRKYGNKSELALVYNITGNPYFTDSSW